MIEAWSAAFIDTDLNMHDIPTMCANVSVLPLLNDNTFGRSLHAGKIICDLRADSISRSGCLK